MQNNCVNDYKKYCGDYGLQSSALNLCMRKGEAIMADWTPEEQLAVDIAFALKKVKIPGFRKCTR
jgi:hypothetical protein